MIYDFTEQLTAKYIFTRAYVAPSPYAGFATFDNGSVLNTSNPNLKPEIAYERTFGGVLTPEAWWSWLHGLTISVDYGRTDIRGFHLQYRGARRFSERREQADLHHTTAWTAWAI